MTKAILEKWMVIETDTKNQNNMVPVCLRYTLELCTYE